MAGNSDDLVISVSSDTSTIRRQLTQLGQDIGQTTSKISNQFEAMGLSIDKSMTPMQRRINEMVGAPFTSKVKEWTGALATTSGAMDKVSHSAGANTTSMQAMMHATRSMTEQLALGVSPAQALIGQLSHLSYVASQPGGITAAFEEMKGKALGLVTAFPEVAIAVGIGAAAFAAYEIFADAKVKTVDEVLQQHAENIKKLGPAYEAALPSLTRYATESERLANLHFRTDANDALKTRVAEAQTAIENLVKSEGIFSSRFSGAKGAIDDFIASIKAGNPEAVKFQETIASLQASGTITEKVAQDLIRASQAASDAEEKLRTVSGSVDSVAKAMSDMSRALGDDISSHLSQLSDVQRKSVEDLIQQLSSGKISAEQFKDSLTSLSGVAPDFSGAIASVSGLADQLERAQKAALGLANTTPKTGRLGYDPMAAASSQYDNNLEMWRRFGHDEDVGLTKPDPKTPKKHGSKAPALTADDQFTNDIQGTKDRTAALMEEFNALGLSYEAQTKRKISLTLEQTALKQVREEARKKGDADWQNAQLTPDQIKKIDEVSAAYARQAEILKEAQAAQQLQRDVLQGVFDDLRTSLEAGQLNWKTFGDMALHVLDKIIAKIETDLIDSIMQANNAGGGGVLGTVGTLGLRAANDNHNLQKRSAA